MKFIKIIRYQVGGIAAEFVPLARGEQQGYTHRVTILHDNAVITEDLLPAGQPVNEKTAEAFCKKHITKIVS